MKKLLIFILLVIFSSIAHSHPGKTDKSGGHKCWKDCYEWDLDYGEYHLHDKDFRPIRLGRETSPEKPGKLPEIKDDAVPKIPPTVLPEVVRRELHKEIPEESTVVQKKLETAVQEDTCVLDPLHLALSALVLILLLILLAIRVRRRR